MRRSLFIIIAAIACFSIAMAQVSVKATKYHPGRGGAGWRTASGDRIDNGKLKRYEIRWVALSPDLFKTLGVQMNDTVEIQCDNENLNGLWVVKDKMSKRKRRSIDFLLPYKDNTGFNSHMMVTIDRYDADDQPNDADFALD